MSKSVVIVGGGVIGLCTAWYALEKGHRVTILERGAPTHDACSLGNAGMIVPSHFVPLAAPGMVALGIKMMVRPESPFYVRPRFSGDLLRWGWLFSRSANATHVARSAPVLRDLNLASRTAYEELAARFGDTFGLVKRGLLMLCQTSQALHHEAELAEKSRTLGVPAEVLTPHEAAQLDPDIRMEIAGAVHFPQDCHFSPQQFLARLTGELEKNGATFAWHTDVAEWRTENGRIRAAQTAQGEYGADEFVLAGGVWSPETLRDLGLRLPMQAGKGYSLTLPAPPQLPRLCSILTEARVAVTPMGSTLRIGGTMEITGLDASVSERRVEGIRKSVARYFPAFSADDLRGVPIWSGLRPCSPDGLPYVGRVARWPNLSLAAGHGMMGMSLGPITGKLMAQIVSGESPEIEVSTLKPDRFG